MTDANTYLVQRQLSNLHQQMIPAIQAYNEENVIVEEECDSLKNGILKMESRQQTEKV